MKNLIKFVAENGKETEDPFVFLLPDGTYTITTENGEPVVKEFIPAGNDPN